MAKKKKEEVIDIPFRKKATQDFTGQDLRASDMRDTDYIECDFTDAILQGCNFAGSTFKKCTFANTDARWSIGLPDEEGVIK